MKLILLSITIFLSFTARKCSKQNTNTASSNTGTPQGVPACIQRQVDSLKKQPPWNPPAEIWEYSYNEKRVFLFSADCCDNFNALVDENCNYVCAPSGGFTGRGDGKCKDFDANAKKLRLIWKDERGK